MFANGFKVITLFGIDIRIDPSWLLIATLIVWSLSTSYFPEVLAGQTDPTYLLMATAGAIGFFASLVLHELGHSLVARRFGVRIRGITLFVFGGVAELEGEPQTAVAEFWIAIAGPATSIALAAAFWFASRIVPALDLGATSQSVTTYLSLINLVLAVFNLLPAFPLDGGRIYRALLWNRSGDFIESTRKAGRLGEILAFVLIGLGLLSVFSGQGLGGLWQVFIGLFLLSAARGTYQQTLMTAGLRGKTVANMMTRTVHSASPDQSLSELVNIIMLRHRTSFVPVVEDDTLLGYVDSDVLGRIDRENWSSTTVGDVFVPMDDSNTLSPDLAANDVLARMLNDSQRKFLVARDHRLLGVITLSDLREYLGILLQVGAPVARPPRIRSGRGLV